MCVAVCLVGLELLRSGERYIPAGKLPWQEEGQEHFCSTQ